MPGSRPHLELARALRGTEPGNRPARDEADLAYRMGMLAATLRRGPLGLADALDEQPLDFGQHLLLVVDQFEELFRFHDGQQADEAEAFVALLLGRLSARRGCRSTW